MAETDAPGSSTTALAVGRRVTLMQNAESHDRTGPEFLAAAGTGQAVMEVDAGEITTAIPVENPDTSVSHDPLTKESRLSRHQAAGSGVASKPPWDQETHGYAHNNNQDYDAAITRDFGSSKSP
ncbi:hypothetical protein H257_13397 [Aphanomyces astaci]|uniref:Uncharacterized protein n=1 Tax=Aphanomyces astaci TaxID=112090 RepID=W4FWT6_APHAT|nr:hypothetical protein H257_13397 [Aphanomyces astaci]ETV71259.1 hypothetical protein H257_13397 [Aphanomyces astaci]|eukprot:XP_009839199.1 hypothetical protein H257_13397 [Aphanomyces astaci]